MLFSSVTFLYWFLPITLILYFLSRGLKLPLKVGNWVLLAASIVFYAWGEPKFLLLIFLQSLSGWVCGLFIEKWRGTGKSKAALAVSLIIGFGGLLFFKYANFIAANLNYLPGVAIPPLRIALPLGISFYTFQILSYDIDLYRQETGVQRNYFTFAAYVMFFPQLIAGPIVRYADVERELISRSHSIEDFANGVRRFVIGLGKKVLLANTFGELVEAYKSSGENSLLFVWLYMIAYSLHVYFDFSGYSDMAIGMGRMFGFKFLENFDYPYISKSVTEFWRRWHMSLGTWFKDYIYIPLGGSRVSRGRFIFNTMVVWAFTGLWHGAGWNFPLWGLFFGVVMLIEKFWLGKFLERLPSIVQRLYLFLLVFVSWAIFDGLSLAESFGRIGALFGVGVESLAGAESLYYLGSYALVLCVGILGATPLVRSLALRWEQSGKAEKLLTALQPLYLAVLLCITTAYLIDGSFNPFIYFRF
jgi:alginate O-acetyltransferase complex protein AlgI